MMATMEHTTQRLPLSVRLTAAILPVFTKIHLALYRRTGGTIGGRIAGNPILLLTTIGRKTGQQRTTALGYIADGDALVIIAGAAGSPKHPAWWLNLQANPETQVQIGRRVLQVRATEATPEEEQRILSCHPEQRVLFDAMQQAVTRKIPVVLLRPVI
jgi:deazaflavin-dependent oxidoreductase (nitroreductase family)